MSPAAGTSERVVDVSIDFDFFIREELDWDWGHNESAFMSTVLWPIRYASSLNVYAETDIDTYADFHPWDIRGAFKQKGLRWVPGGMVAYADSHAQAHSFFQSTWEDDGPPDLLVNMDAHHDFFSEPETKGIDCGNWLTALWDEWHGDQAEESDVNFEVVYPGWLKHASYDTPNRPVRVSRWPEWVPKRADVRHVFLCLSSAWVPPHHDETFVTLVQLLGLRHRTIVEVQPIPDRQQFILTPEEAAKEREIMQQRLKELQSAEGS